MRIGVGKTAVAIDNMTIHVRINEAVISLFKTIFSTNQVQAWGHVENDVFKKIGGKQAIFLDQETINIPLKYIAALMYMPIRKPTRKKLNEEKIFYLIEYRI